MLIDKRKIAACEKIETGGEEKTDMVSGIWASTTMSAALTILESVKRL